MLHRLLWTAVVLSGIGVASLPVNAAPVILNTWYTFCFGGPGTSLTALDGCALGTNPPDGHPVVGAPDPAWTITTVSPTLLHVQDGFLSVDRFNLFDMLAVLGPTSAPIPGSDCGSDITCAVSNLAFSRGDFLLAPGPHSITGTQIVGIPGAGFFELTAVPAVPEPASITLLGISLFGLAGLGVVRRRKLA